MGYLQTLKEQRENRRRDNRDQYVWLHFFIFMAIHLSPIMLFFVETTWIDWTVCGILYFVRMFFITGGYHRYFSHRTYKTSRVFQFILAFMAQTSLQKGALWWGANHRLHHRHSDTFDDPHSMKLFGFFYSHMGWLFSPNFRPTRSKVISDFYKFKELRWLNKYHLVAPLTLLLAVFLFGGYYHSTHDDMTFMQGALIHGYVAFLVSTVILYHGTFSINSLMHKLGKARYNSGDSSKNHLILALITLGEGWHNNHHHYMSSTRQGFFWWEIDITYYILKMLSWFGIVWDLQPVPSKFKYAHQQEQKEAA